MGVVRVDPPDPGPTLLKESVGLLILRFTASFFATGWAAERGRDPGVHHARVGVVCWLSGRRSSGCRLPRSNDGQTHGSRSEETRDSAVDAEQDRQHHSSDEDSFLPPSYLRPISTNARIDSTAATNQPTYPIPPDLQCSRSCATPCSDARVPFFFPLSSHPLLLLLPPPAAALWHPLPRHRPPLRAALEHPFSQSPASLQRRLPHRRRQPSSTPLTRMASTAAMSYP